MDKDTKELLIAVVAIVSVVGLLLGGITAYAGMYPPFTVVNSGSMQHSEDSDTGIVDAGDMMIVQKFGKKDITTYVEGSQTGYEKFGEYGDVIVYDHPDRRTNIIHRAMVELELKSSDSDLQEWYIPSLKDYQDWDFVDRFDHHRAGAWNEDTCILSIASSEDDCRFKLTNVGYGDVDVSISLWDLGVGHEAGYHGYLTKGDNASTNRVFDQNGIVNGLVTDDMIVSTAEVEIPWLGCIKLMLNDELSQNIPSNSKTNLIITVIVLIIAILALSYGIGYIVDRGKSAKNDENDEKTYVRKSKQRK